MDDLLTRADRVIQDSFRSRKEAFGPVLRARAVAARNRRVLSQSRRDRAALPRETAGSLNVAAEENPADT